MPLAEVLSQGAVQAVRQRVQGVGAPPAEERPSRSIDAAPIETAPSQYSSDGALDTTFVTPGAVAVAVLRPAQIMTSPIAEVLPTEVATAAGLQFGGVDPVDVEEVVAFFDLTSGLSYGVTFKFNKPFRGASIPPEQRAHAQLAELAGRKYLQSGHPLLPSFYGTDKTTLILAPDATLRQLLGSTGGGPSGPLVERVRGVQAGNDLYVAVDVASLRPMLEMQLAPIAGQLPPEAQALLDMPKLVSVVELTFNLSPERRTSLVVHANDEAAAMQLESQITQMMAQSQDKLKARFAESAAGGGPMQRAFLQYQERAAGLGAEASIPRREGAQLIFLSAADDDPANEQMKTMFGLGLLMGRLMPKPQGVPALSAVPEASEPPAEQPPDGESGP